MNIATTTTGRIPAARGPRKPLSQLILEGAKCDVGVTHHPYFDLLGPIGSELRCDPLLLAFVGKFGTRLLDEIVDEYRIGDPWVEARKWDREQLVEKATRAINGGLPEVHRRLHEYPKLYVYLCEHGFRHQPGTLKEMRGPKGVSVFRAIAHMTNPMFMSPAEIAGVLAEHKL